MELEEIPLNGSKVTSQIDSNIPKSKTLSTMNYINCGVPQGSLLGPFLFLLYIDDINDILIFLNFYLFADDTVIFSSHKSNIDSNQIISDELKNVTDWLTANKLSLNISKSNFLNFILHKQTSNNIKLDNYTCYQIPWCPN